jgi:inner membrane protein
MLTGAVLARTGFNRKAAYAVGAMVVAAEFPDVDIAWGYIAGPVAGLEHHRGITHTFLALPVEALLITGCFWVAQRWRSKAHDAPVSWGWLYAGCLVALLSHILLDWTNNYGVRPFFPFNPRWYAGSFVFIFEPVMFALLLIALIAPALFGLINSEVGARRERFRGRGWAIAGLIGIAALYVVRFTERSKAIDIAAQNKPAGTSSIFASPHPGNPFLWSMVTDTPEFYQLSTVNTWRGEIEGPQNDLIYKPPVSLPILAAKRTYLGRIYLDWSMYPVLSQTPDTSDPNHPLMRVSFADARFMYDSLLSDGRDHPALTGSVTLDMAAPEGDRVVEMMMNGKPQK